MYSGIITPQTVKCSKCGCINHYEDVTRGDAYRGGQTTIRRCLNASCKHESVISTTTSNFDERAFPKPQIYTTPLNNEKTF
jgi:hypothetical protein